MYVYYFSGTEVLLTQALEDMTKERTTLVIAHRLSTIRKVCLCIDICIWFNTLLSFIYSKCIIHINIYTNSPYMK